MKTSIRKATAMFLSITLALTSVLAYAFANDTTIDSPARRNSVPVAENIKITTFRGIAITGFFKALDPDGDMMTFEITSEPKKGVVTSNSTGEFVYSPNEKSKGKDSFTYVAVDCNGGVSASATVTVNIKKQSSKTTYSDMDGNPAYYAALVLSENGIFTGESLGGETFFRPDATVTRGEFLAMCMAMIGTEKLDGITKTGFFDDSDTPLWLKPYISAGLLNGIVGGFRDESGHLVFASDAPITYYEAAVLLDRALGLTDVISVASMQSDIIPAWAQAAAVNVTACGIVPSGLSDIGSDSLTRADAATILLRSLEVFEARASNGGLLGWAK